MDTRRTGGLIRSLREERGLTQLQLAQLVGVGDKAVSKWERGGGCPDVSLLPALAAELGCPVETLLAGSLSPDEAQGGTMKRTAFRICPACGNIITTTGTPSSPAAAGSSPRCPSNPPTRRTPCRWRTWRATGHLERSGHPMEKGHHLCLAAVVGYDRLAVEKLYPEQGGEARLPRLPGGVLYTCCTEHGLMRHAAPACASPRRQASTRRGMPATPRV